MTVTVALPWLALPGLAGGIDKDGSRAAELLGLGFGSVEFGSVTARPIAGVNPGVGALVARLQQLDRALPGGSAIGVGLGLSPDACAENILDEWLAGLGATCAVADYVSLNLSARANQRFLDPVHRASLKAALRAVAGCRDQQMKPGRPLALAVKMPLAEAASWFDTLSCDGFEQLTVVLPDDGSGLDELARLSGRADWPVIVAVGGIRDASTLAAIRKAGATGVQIHRLFVEQGAACLSALI